MSLRLTPMSDADYQFYGEHVKDGIASTTSSVANLFSESVFGRPDTSTDGFPGASKRVAQDHARGYITLSVPVVNIVLAGKSCSYLSRYINQTAADLAAIYNLSLVRRKGSKELVEVSSIPADQNVAGISYGAELIKELIDEFNPTDAIREVLRDTVNHFYKSNHLAGDYTLERGRGAYIVVGDWMITPEIDSDVFDKLPYYVASQHFTSHSNKLAYWLRFEEDKSPLYGCVIDKIMVLPVNMRPKMDGRNDRLIKPYDSIISASKQLGLMVQNSYNLVGVLEQYRVLQSNVNVLLDEDPRDKKRKGILGKLEGKKGHIRGKMLGKRIDFSGRSVITIDPTLSIREINIPRDMAPKLYRHHILRNMSHPSVENWTGKQNDQKCIDVLEDDGEAMLRNIPVIIGRQPTLHRPSMRGFKANITDTRSIQINPLCVTGFNADFDGDQMWVRVPTDPKSVEEVTRLMMMDNAIYLPKNGECSVAPRQEIIYGLYLCTMPEPFKSEYTPTRTSFASRAELFDALFNQELSLGDNCSCQGISGKAGHVAFLTCLPPAVAAKHPDHTKLQVTSKTIKTYIQEMLALSTSIMIDFVDAMVRLGFGIAGLYPPTLNLLDIDPSAIKNTLQTFHAEVDDSKYYYNRGLMDESEFQGAFNAAYDSCSESASSDIYPIMNQHLQSSGENQLGSGFVLLADSGARGSKGNILQCFGYKGQMMKSGSEAFLEIIEDSFMDQLTPFEHFITCYGGRQNLITKTLSSADTGYAMRLMWHASSPLYIVSTDCGTTEGVSISRSEIKEALGLGTEKDDGQRKQVNIEAEVDSVIENIITGRYEAGTDMFFTPALAKERVASHPATITIRSPLTCKCPCCRKCYGEDLATHRLVELNTAVGFVAAQSIGEPGTQLNMDAFKSGGVAQKRSAISGFAKLQNYIQCKDLGSLKVPYYDPVAWETGPVREVYTSGGDKQVYIEGSRHHISMPQNVRLTSEAIRGRGLCVESGERSVPEMLAYTDVPTTQRHMMYGIYSVYRNEGGVNMKHIECLIASMTMHMIISTDRPDLVVGQFCDTQTLLNPPAGYNNNNTLYSTTIRPVSRVQRSRIQALSAICMEGVHEGISRAVMLRLEDTLTFPINRIMMGLTARPQ